MDAAARRPAAAGSRPRWWTELPLLALVYAAYSAGRLVARGDVHAATGHGETILRWEELLRIDPERALNRLFTSTPALGIPADFAYASLHYLVTPAVLIWLWHRRPAHYRTLRTWLMLATLIGLIGFTLLPTAPPRLLDTGSGFADTMARFSSYGWWGDDASAPRGLGGMTNQFAAMPSLHVGWALWCGAVLWKHGRSRATRALAVAYPLVIVLVVMGTANHYLLDALAGTAVMGLGLLLTRPALRLAERVRGTGAEGGSVSAGAAGTPADVSGGCETSAGERIPRQPTRRGRPTAAAAASAAAADDRAAAAAR
ncbi:phosphatase PAP2 family protein [Streptomyces albofaciens JCM 4342]|uniref:phosphatase PAP2 family protein n=1 Tax=Streptomyces albofaciens TaxID=66866 RepID=UPI00123B6175|nr:phosphatase PAP2 family protein [Streptomyces albofaciens]KAA6221702.1 phosphatase PAP2 family protein [Streptomyces albofaciens JCM 4342]